MCRNESYVTTCQRKQRRHTECACNLLETDSVPRVISFIVLIGVLLLIAAMFFQVMLKFVVPLFLAAVLVVIFEPLHRTICRYLPNSPRFSAMVTTFLILIVVLAPIVGLGFAAYIESADYVEKFVDEKKFAEIEQQIKSRTKPIEDWYENQYGKLPDITALVKNSAASIGANIGAAGLTGLKFFVTTVIGLLIMILALYYFLADGPAMIDGLMYLTPLDDAYERELLEKFAETSRTVVVAMLLAAVAQGALAGIGYYLALDSGATIFLLTALTMVLSILALSPHPDDPATTQWKAALVLAIYCAIIVSGVDNIIKPWVLHGQAKLHPLLALLSILGGIQVMGPIGILVGPMLVTFLQTLLKMVRKELDHFREVSEKSAISASPSGDPPLIQQSPPEASTALPKSPTPKKRRKK